MRARLLRLATALLIATPAAAADRAPQVSATLSRAGEGTWYVDYVLPERARAWVFPRSNPDMDGAPWRLETWRVETPGVTLVRAGRYDALVAESGAVPPRVRLRITPFTKPMRADYTPALAFSDGGIAFYSDHFLVAPRTSLAEVAALPDDLSSLPDFERPNVVTLSDPGRRVIAKGVIGRDRAQRLADDADMYLYTGDGAVVETPALAGVFDPGLPAWLRQDIDAFVPRLFDLYRERLGPPAGGRPMAFVSWKGTAQNGWSFGGSVLRGTVVMAIGGKQVLERTPQAVDRMRWFLGHESAHFWLGQTIGYASRRAAWITEGSADLMGIRAQQRLLPGYDPLPELQRELEECLRLNPAGVPLATAEVRGQTRANYTCGAMLALAAEGATRKRQPDADVFSFLRTLIDRNRDDGRVSSEEWVAAFVATGGDPGLGQRVLTFVERGDPDPAGLLAALFTAGGIPFSGTGEAMKLR